MPIGAYKTLGDLLVLWLNGQEVMQTLVLEAVYKNRLVVEVEQDNAVHVYVAPLGRTATRDDRRGHFQRVYTMVIIVQKKLTSTSEEDAETEIDGLNELVDEIELLLSAVPNFVGTFGEFGLVAFDIGPGKPPFDDEEMQRQHFVSSMQCQFMTVDGLI